MVKSVLCTLIFFNSFFSFSQYQIKGKVVDSAKNPIVNSSITLKKSNSENVADYTFSDDKGFFVFENLNLGKYNIEITALSFLSEKISVESTESKNDL